MTADGSAKDARTALEFTIDASSSVAPFEQLKRAISGDARSGALPVGTRLPPVRSLADSAGLAANTVARAYRELEHEGVVVTRGRAGTFVAATSDAEREAADAAAAFAERVAGLGLSPEAVLALARAALDARGR